MKKFKENNCRLCKQAFCCKSCRLKHEEKIHYVNTECDICIYGQIYLVNPTDHLLKHITDTHLPLHCLLCKMVFETITGVRCKCPNSIAAEYQNVIKTPSRIIIEESEYESPPVMYPFNKSTVFSSNYLGTAGNIISVTTSTPMQPNEDQNNLNNIANTITPVDQSSEQLKSIKENYSGISPTASSERTGKKEVGLKRRVTFCETSIIENIRRSEYFISEEKCQHSILKDEKIRIVQDTSILDENYYKKQNFDTTDLINESKSIIEDVENHGNGTLWESAMNFTCLEVKSPKDEVEKESCNNFKASSYVENCEDFAATTSFISENESSISHRKRGLWSSMATYVKSVIYGSKETVCIEKDESTIEENSFKNKRGKPEGGYESEDFPLLKKRKLTEIACRKPIRPNLKSLSLLSISKMLTCDKATQTEVADF